MKLRNKKTGEIATLTLSSNGEDMIIMGNDMLAHRTKLSELKDYEDYEEPRSYWCINWCGGVDEIICFDAGDTAADRAKKEFGNYFKSKEEAERAVEKLKAWKRLKDKGVTFDNSLTMFDLDGCVGIRVYIPKGVSATDDFEIIFGGEE